MSLWLPLQGVAGIVMPFCKHSLAANGAQPTGLHMAGHQNMDTMNRHHAHPGSSLQQHEGTEMLTAACDDCGHCHLSTALTLPAAALHANSVQISVFPRSIVPALAGIIPHPLNRPPLLA